jgi:maltooligosyltrehalose trehalohydrolase
MDRARNQPRMRRRRLPVGSELLPRSGVHFRVWAPDRKRVEVVLEDGSAHGLQAESHGYYSAVVPGAGVGTRYRYRLDDDALLYPDPASRFQPDGPHGDSEVVDPDAFEWTDDDWRGIQLPGQVIDEMHVGTFTQEGTWRAAMRELPELASAGMTIIEMMPVADFPGRFGWGYDGVDLFAPTRLYGHPDDLRAFVDHAHACGLGVLLDVVYNHLGPDGNYLKQFARAYASTRYTTKWGEALNFDDENSGPVREFVLANAAYWIDEFHFDGLRIDATQDIFDSSEQHILGGLTRRVREAARGRSTLVIGENEPQDTRLVRPLEAGGHGFDAAWNDDFHHSAIVQLSGHYEAYDSDYRGRPQEFISALKRGYLYQGQWYRWQNKRRGKPTDDIAPASFVLYIQNHDQIANSARGRRGDAVASPGAYKAMTALMLLAPATPMLFQGQEFAASSPFYYFVDHEPELAALVDKGRKEFMAQFPSMARPEVQAWLPTASDPATFEASKLRFEERDAHADMYALHRDLLQLRCDDPVFRAQRGTLDGAVLSEEGFVIRFFGSPEEGDRLLVVNFGTDVYFTPAPEPLLAPPLAREWEILWSSDDFRYGGDGTMPLDTERHWHIPGKAAVVLAPKRKRDAADQEP